MWIAMLHGHLTPVTVLAPVQWHAHEMIFGYTGAVLAGFLFTAASNWTKRDTAVGSRLAAITCLWIGARLASALGQYVSTTVSLVLDLLFLGAAAVAIGLPLLKTKSRRNYVFPVAILGLAICDTIIHLAQHLPVGLVLRAWPVALDWIVLVMLLFAGRIVPLFTRNATPGLSVRENDLRDKLGLGLLWALLAADATVAGKTAAGVALAAGLLNLIRLRGWGGSRCVHRPILWVLHLGWLWLCVGLILKGVAGLGLWLSPSLATHVTTVAGIGTMTMGMMSRVSLGHTGRALKVSATVAAAYVLVSAAALVRVLGPTVRPSALSHWLWTSSALWALAFGLFFIVHVPILLGPRVDAARGQRSSRLAVMN
jgi:uncharacterized protein involved in response to NO